MQWIKEDKVKFNNKKQLLCSNNLSLEMKRNLYKVVLECRSLWIRNMDPREKKEKGS